MSQDYQSIGQESRDLQRVTRDRHSWQGDSAETLGQMEIDPTWSFRRGRANRQQLGADGHDSFAAAFFNGSSMAAHEEPPAAALQPDTFGKTSS